MKQLHVAVLMGGPSHEYAVSLRSGAQVARALDRRRFRVTPIVISKQQVWVFPKGRAHRRYLRTPDALEEFRRRRVDVAFLAVHGEFGEDGRIQLLLESAGIPYTGSGVAASALAMDKAHSAYVFRRHGLAVPAFVSFSRHEWRTDRDSVIRRVKQAVRFPWAVKPANAGSSVGVTIVKEWGAFPAAIRAALAVGDRAIAQEYIAGREATCGVLDARQGKDPVALPPTEIVPKTAAFFDYRAKYDSRATDEITPARFAAEVNAAIQDIALTAHGALGCRGISRTDVIVSPERGIFVLEINTLPGMTAASLFPKAAAAAGISFPALVEKLVLAAVR